VEDTSDKDDNEETLQDRFQLRSRISRPGLPHVPLVQDPPASLEASLAAPPRKPRNASRKRMSKKLKVTETTSPEVSHLEYCSRVLVSRVHLLMKKFPCLQELPPTEPIEEGDGDEWDTVGEATGSCSPAPTVEELLAQMEHQPLLLRGARSLLLLLLLQKKWWPQGRRRVLHPRLSLQKRRRPPRLDWWTSPTSSAPRP
jgi:hypothetical protein